MVIHDLHVIGVTLQPDKTNTPLIINANTVLAIAVTLQRFQSVPGQRRECSHIWGSVQHIKFPQRLPLDGLEPAHRFSKEKLLCIRASKGTDHNFRLYCYPVNVNQ
jgi:hypothetical protein